MTGFIDLTIRTETHKTGKFLEDLAEHIPYAKVVGYGIAVPNSKPKTAPTTGEEPTRIDYGRLSDQQKAIVRVLKERERTIEEIKETAGFAQISGAARAANNLIKKKYIVRHGVVYSLK